MVGGPVETLTDNPALLVDILGNRAPVPEVGEGAHGPVLPDHRDLARIQGRTPSDNLSEFIDRRPFGVPVPEVAQVRRRTHREVLEERLLRAPMSRFEVDDN